MISPWAGRCAFTSDAGEPIEIRAGDALMMPANTTGIRDIQETARKPFVLIGQARPGRQIHR